MYSPVAHHLVVYNGLFKLTNPIRPILSIINTFDYKLAKYFVSILELYLKMSLP